MIHIDFYADYYAKLDLMLEKKFLQEANSA